MHEIYRDTIGVQDAALNWFDFYSTDSTQCVTIENVLSGHTNLLFGVHSLGLFEIPPPPLQMFHSVMLPSTQCTMFTRYIKLRTKIVGTGAI